MLRVTWWQQETGDQRGQPRPPVLFKKHEPCRDTTKMDVMAFMDHLKGLDWYTGQVTEDTFHIYLWMDTAFIQAWTS